MDKERILHAADAIGKGYLIVYPTDTLYALGASITNKKAIVKLFSVKHRPESMPVPIAVSNQSMLKKYVYLSPLAKRLAQQFFPGKITLICQKKTIIPEEITAGKDTVAVRIPDDDIARFLIEKTGPLVVTSANIHRQNPSEKISEIRKLFKASDVAVYIDDGPRKGKPSTIVDGTGSTPKIIREGCISKRKILQFE